MIWLKGNKGVIRVLGMFVVFLILRSPVGAFAQETKNIENFDIHGLKLNMKLDQVIRAYQINNVIVNKDSAGVINGYEVKKRIPENKIKLVLHFTSEKNLYRIIYSKLFDGFRFRSTELYDELKRKYGPASTDNLDSDGEARDIHACWGESCKRFPQTTPTLTANIRYSSGGLSLRLTDIQIFNEDWKIYKSRMGRDSGAERESSPVETNPRRKLDF